MKLSRLAYFQVISLISLAIMSLVLISPFSVFDTSNHIEHSLFTEAGAANMPLNIDQLYKSKDMVGDAQGGFGFLKVEENVIDVESHCEFCTKVEYVPGPAGVAGVAYMNDNNGFDLSSAKKVSFYVMGAQGDEVVKFKAAGKKIDETKVKLKDIFKKEKFNKVTKDVKLDNKWKKIEIDLSGTDLKGITHPFAFEISKNNNKQKTVFYLKAVTFDSQTPKNPVQLEAGPTT